MTYLVKHQGGVEIQVTQEIYNRCRKSNEYKCRVLDNSPRTPEPPVKVSPDKWPKPDDTGPWFTLSNGKRIKGKANAKREQAKL